MSTGTHVYFGPFGLLPAVPSSREKFACEQCGKEPCFTSDAFCSACGGPIAKTEVEGPDELPYSGDVFGEDNEKLVIWNIGTEDGPLGALLPNQAPEGEGPLGWAWSDYDDDGRGQFLKDSQELAVAVAMFKRAYAKELEMAARFAGVEEIEVRFGVVCHRS